MKSFLETEIIEIDRSKECLGDYLLNWFKLYKKNNLKETTYDRNEMIIEKRINPLIGHYQISDLTLDHLQIFFNKMCSAGFG